MNASRHFTSKQPRRRQQDHIIRLMAAFTLILLLFAVLIARFVYLQVAKHEEFVAKAATNRISLIPTPPIRGEITDVNGVVLAHNYPAYSLEVIPNELEMKIEELVEALRPYADISEGDLRRFRRFRAESRSYERIPLKLKLSTEEAARLAAVLFRFKGVEVNARTFREYPYGELTTHILGYIGRISDRDMQKLEEEARSELYRGSTHIGKMGLENFYERQLHGLPGYREVEKDAQGNIVRTLKSVPPASGQTLRLSLDIRMQQKASDLLGNRRGALVAIDPQTGGILALVSKPTYDANLFIDGIDSDTWKALNEDWQRPLINRVTQGLYPPGSTFKPFMGMAALQSGHITMDTVLPSPGAWSIPGSSHLFRDSVRRGHGSANLSKAIQVSSDTFFYRLGYEMGIEKTYPYLAQFGFGQPTGIDLPNEYKGILPSPEWKARRFANANEATRRWKAADMVTISIGQGYNTYTPLQLAHATAVLANDGVVYRPHLVKELLDHQNQTRTLVEPRPSATLPFKREYFEYVKHSMERVLRPGGTAWRLGSGLRYSMGGKTGTAQVVQIKQGATYNAAALAEQHRDHAWFISFAPVDKPQIAIAVLLENGGWGATAAPIARQLSDFYLLQLRGEAGRELPLPKPSVALVEPMSQNNGGGPAVEAARIEAAYRTVSGSPPARPAAPESTVP
ncbi:penicillin-binding protein 2 [Neisseria shayeganii]|uniref:Peptidoglycan D,D-transpeptidase MrdA n=1 Tax=Neisseria shayeganii 871 TaxID=1032488 RepID=G4CGZ5_9NEIS|nr:penicillin-binding protein 2 [Neisseria shayeganii]EGY52938.1 penicillin-binding protein 2 [Neisseria shayeganii 871]